LVHREHEAEDGGVDPDLTANAERGARGRRWRAPATRLRTGVSAEAQPCSMSAGSVVTTKSIEHAKRGED
jgi:hypothetical protein